MEKNKLKERIKMNKDLKALFLGPKAENKGEFAARLNELFNDHTAWRQNYFPSDPAVISEADKSSDTYKQTMQTQREVLSELSRRLRSGCTPWHSLRYLGHMNSETLMAGLLGYFAASLYNANNVAYESSAPTSMMEQEVGEDFAKLMGFEKGWGHIACDGSIANFEGLWYARNLKSIPLTVADNEPELVKGKSRWELLNMKTSEIVDLLEAVPDKMDVLKDHCSRAIGEEIKDLGMWLVPETKHYSWLKAADVLGVGTTHLRAIKLDENFRMDLGHLEQTIRELAAKKIPILGVVAVVGTTEEGAVDRIDKIVELKERLSKEGIEFYFHIDSAYGGYARAIFLDENGEFIAKDKLVQVHAKHGVFQGTDKIISDEVYEAYKAMSHADSITIDPHKMGYIPYAAGGVVIRDIRMRDAISYFASYVFEKNVKVPALLGAFIMEGSKAGATAAAVWAAHRILGLNVAGYGRLIGASMEGAHRLYKYFDAKKAFVLKNGKKVQIVPLIKPDFNMVDFVFNAEGNTDLDALNKLNEDLYNESSIFSGNIYNNGFITSHTAFTDADYGDSPLEVLGRLGVPKAEYERVKSLTLLRACVLSPFLNDEKNFDTYIKLVEDEILAKLEKLLG